MSNGSVVDLVCWHRDPVTVDSINDAVAAAAAGEWNGRLRFEREAIVSADTVGSRGDLHLRLAGGRWLWATAWSKTIAWFDNGWGYLHRLLELVARAGRRGRRRRERLMIRVGVAPGLRGRMAAVRGRPARFGTGRREGLMISVGINGFGRIGRSVFRILADRPNVDVVGINDLFDAERLAYLLRYDTVQGVFGQEVEVTGNGLRVGGRDIPAQPRNEARPNSPGRTSASTSRSSRPACSRTRADVARHLDAGRAARGPHGARQGTKSTP